MSLKEATLAGGGAVAAGPESPEQAICPVCGRVVFRRSRQRMGSKARTYFWQHERGINGGCRPQRLVRPPVARAKS